MERYDPVTIFREGKIKDLTSDGLVLPSELANIFFIIE